MPTNQTTGCSKSNRKIDGLANWSHLVRLIGDFCYFTELIQRFKSLKLEVNTLEL